MSEVKTDPARSSSTSGIVAPGQLNPDAITPKLKKEKKKKKLQEKMQNMDQINLLVHRRGLTKGKVTKILNTIRPLDQEPPILTEAQVNVHLRKVEAAYKEYNDITEQLLALLTEDGRLALDEHYAAFEELYDQVSLILEERQNELKNVALVPNQQNPFAHLQVPMIVQQPLRMPIPTFDGRYENWPKFKAMFKDLVDKTPDPPAVKLYHLDKALVGSAAGLIDAKTINEGNYNHAWVILEERYENKRHTIGKHIDGLLSLKKMSKESHTELRSLVDECTRHVENLKFLEQEFLGVSDLFLVHLLTAALDKDTRRHWESTIKHGELPTYNEMMKYLKEECCVMERCESTNNKQLQTKPAMVPKSHNQKVNATTTSWNEAKCEFCGKSHPNFACPDLKTLTIQERLVKVRERNLCFNCLRRGHRGRDCPSEKTCNKCKRRHHSLLHAEEGVKPTMETRTTINNLEEPKPQDQPPEKAQLTSATCTSERVSIKQVLLLTAVVNVIDKNNKPHPCRVLLDSGSQANLITHQMVEMLGLTQSPTSVIVAGVNSIRSKVSTSTTVQIRSNYSKFRANVKCLVVDAVTTDLPSLMVDVKNWQLPEGVQLADPKFFEPGRVDMLLGGEWFLRLFLPGEYPGDEELPTLRETKLGWVVGGVCVGDNNSSSVHSHVATLEELSKSGSLRVIRRS